MLAPACWAADAPLPDSVRQTSNGAAVRDQVEAFVKEQVAKLVGDDPVAAKEGREALIAAVSQPNPAQPQPSPQFLDVLAEVLNDALKDAAKDKRPQVRLNVAVTVARVAEKANNARLTNAAVVLLDDDNQGVVLWAVKGAKFLIPNVLSSPALAKDNKLMPAFVAAVRKHASSGPIIMAAYDALKINEKPSSAVLAAWKDVAPPVVNALIDIVQERLKLYAQSVPPWPGAEKEAITLLVNRDIWFAKLDAPTLLKLRQRTVQTISDLIGVVAQRLKDVGGERQEVNGLLKNAASGLSVINDELKGDEDVRKLYQMGMATPAEQAAPICQAVILKVRAAFKEMSITPPPTLSNAPAPATTATSQPPGN
jgi:hypothetical protein